MNDNEKLIEAALILDRWLEANGVRIDTPHLPVVSDMADAFEKVQIIAEHTPTTEDVRNHYAYGCGPKHTWGESRDDFDRWLDAFRAEACRHRVGE